MKSAICRGLAILGAGKSTNGGQRKSKCVAKLEKTPLFWVNFSIKKKRPGTDFVSIPGSFMAKVHEVDTILQKTAMQQLHPEVLAGTFMSLPNGMK